MALGLLCGFGMSRSQPLLFAVAFFTTVALAPRLASACSGADCMQPAEFVLAKSGRVPANFSEITSYHAKPLRLVGNFDIRMWEESAPTTILKQGRMLAANDPPVFALGRLIEGKRYVVEATPKCVWGDGREETRANPLPAQQFRFTAGPAHEAPQTLGSLRIVRQGAATVPWGGGSGCWENLEANAVELALDLSAWPEAWRELLTQYQLIVDGKPFDWTLSIGGGYAPENVPRGSYGGHPGAFQVWTRCGPLPQWITPDPEGKTDGAKPGKHEVWVRARVPETPPSFIESAHVSVELGCPKPTPAEPPQVEPTSRSPEPMQPEPAVAPDEGVEDHDGEVSDTADSEDDLDEESSTMGRKTATGNCSVEATAARAGWAGWLGALALSALLVRRRTGVRAR